MRFSGESLAVKALGGRVELVRGAAERCGQARGRPGLGGGAAVVGADELALAGGPGAVPRRSSRSAKAAPPMKILADPALWEIVRKILAHKALRDEVARLAAGYSDPADE